MSTQIALFQPSPGMTYSSRDLPSLPSFAGLTRLGFDTETDMDPVYRRLLYGISYRTPDGREGYLSIRHPESRNYSEETIRRWARAELAGKELVCANAKHEAHVMRTFGVDLEEIGCTFSDVFHQAALLNEKRYQLNLDLIAKEELGRGKVHLAGNVPIHERPAEEVAPYAVEDARLALELDAVYQPQIEAQSLQQVLKLENDLVYSTVEMERNGAFLDVEMLVKWERETRKEYEQRLFEIHKQTGMNINPGSSKDMARLFDYLGLQSDAQTEKGNPSYTEDVLLKINHPVVQLVLEAQQLKSMRAKFLIGYLAVVEPDGRLRYELHQLRSEREGVIKGTISGRYSSSNINVQQVQKQSKQPKLLQRWPIRKLFIPPPGEKWVSSDASQIQFRIFAHYAQYVNSRRLIDAYNNDPKTDFHALVVDWTGLIRDEAKNVNFAKLFGGGVQQVADMCKTTFGAADKICWKYDTKFPEAKRLIQFASRIAERRGYVKTFDGRRARFQPGDKFYPALCSIFQGTEAGIVKRKVLETYRERKRLGLTLLFPLHDEFDGTQPVDSSTKPFDDLLNTQTTRLRVPILWETKSGPNWQETK